MESDNDDNPKLPEDLLIEIFLRSSVESLLRVKCVCKHWYGLIKDRNFEHKFLEYQKNGKQTRVLLQYFNPEAREMNYYVLDDIAKSSTMNHFLEYLQVINHSLDIEGPINGLYCLFTGKDRIVLWNPALIDYKILPSPPLHFKPHYKVSDGSIGFGFDPLTNDHKVVLFRSFWSTFTDYPVYENHVVTLYNLTTNTWKPLDLGDIQLLGYSVDNNRTSSFINETYHWWVTSGVVLAFNMRNETFRVIPGPDISEFDGVYYDSTTIAVYEEGVALMRCNDLFVNIWVMFEEGIWIKQFSIGPLQGLFWPIGFWKKDRVFLVINDSEEVFFDPNARLVLYDVNTQEMKNVGPTAAAYGFRTCVYHESLITLDGGSQNDGDMVSDFLDEAPSTRE